MPLIEYLSRIHFDFGAVSRLGDHIAEMGLGRPLLVTDQGVANAGILQRVLDAAKPSVPVVYDGTTGNPTEQSLLECLQIWHDRGCDGIIALGGGSPIDLAKAIALLSSHGGSLADHGVGKGESDRIGQVSPQIAIPTAAGTGAEVGRACVMSLLDGSVSVAVNLNMVADVVICDPELTLSLPPGLTAATGIDALAHGVESCCSSLENPPAAAIGLEAARRAARWLPVAVEDGSNREARCHMMMAALMGGMCLQKSLGGAHAMAAPLGELGLHHGTLVGILLPHILGFNDGHADAAFADIRQAMRVPEDRSLHHWMAEFVRELGLPTRLAELGIAPDLLSGIAGKASGSHLSATNPRPASTRDYLGMLKNAM